MKRILIVLFVSLFLLTGFKFHKSDKARIAFSLTPFTKEGKYTPATHFNIGEKVYFAIYNPDGFKTRLAKVQIIKKESEKSEFLGARIFLQQNGRINKQALLYRQSDNK